MQPRVKWNKETHACTCTEPYAKEETRQTQNKRWEHSNSPLLLRKIETFSCDARKREEKTKIKSRKKIQNKTREDRMGGRGSSNAANLSARDYNDLQYTYSCSLNIMVATDNIPSPVDVRAGQEMMPAIIYVVE